MNANSKDYEIELMAEKNVKKEIPATANLRLVTAI